MSFSTFPRIPHLPGSNTDAGDLLLDDDGAAPFLTERVHVYEKLDGINVMITGAGRGRVEAFLKPEWRGAGDGAVERALSIWLRQRERELAAVLGGGGCLYGEWLWHRVSVAYDALDDVFVAFAARDRSGRLLPQEPLTKLLAAADVAKATPLWSGVLGDVHALKRLMGRSRLGRAPMEGLIVERLGRRVDDDARYAKWVSPGYRHPAKGTLSGEKNRLLHVAWAPRGE